MKAIFRWLEEVRSPAPEALSQFDRLETATDILWATDQNHMRMHDLILADFRYHQVVVTALNVHLFEHRVPTTVFIKLDMRVRAL